MLDLIWEAIQAIFESGEEIASNIDEVVGNMDWTDVLLIGSAIYVANLTVSSIQDELRNRKELKEKGVTHVILKEIIENNEKNCTVLSLEALNAQNKSVGTFKMEGKSCSGLHKGQTIAI